MVAVVHAGLLCKQPRCPSPSTARALASADSRAASLKSCETHQQSHVNVCCHHCVFSHLSVVCRGKRAGALSWQGLSKAPSQQPSRPYPICPTPKRAYRSTHLLHFPHTSLKVREMFPCMSSLCDCNTQGTAVHTSPSEPVGLPTCIITRNRTKSDGMGTPTLARSRSLAQAIA